MWIAHGTDVLAASLSAFHVIPILLNEMRGSKGRKDGELSFSKSTLELNSELVTVFIAKVMSITRSGLETVEKKSMFWVGKEGNQLNMSLLIPFLIKLDLVVAEHVVDMPR